jgi:AraC-like DNA-binding protein
VLLETIGIAIAGFAVVSAVTLFTAYAFFIELPNKSSFSIITCAALLVALASLQVHHLSFFQNGIEPLGNLYYRSCLFVIPALFFFFGRWAILPNQPFRPVMLLHLVPLPLFFALPLAVALPILFLTGTAYSIWLGSTVYGLRAQRTHFQFELFFFVVISILASIVLVLGFAVPYIDAAWFYYVYTAATGLAFAILTVALIANPELLGDLTDAAKAKYGTSTLREVDVDACLKKLHSLMTESNLYQNEDLSLGSLAEAVGVSSHQLSELINSRLGMGFHRYLREHRIAAAKALLLASPSQSILSVSMETGFRSQSSFYAAFKEVTGRSPGDYRKSGGRQPPDLSFRNPVNP